MEQVSADTLTGPPAADRSFERLTSADAAHILSTAFGREALQPATRLATERDDTFRLLTAEGEFILKVAHPDDDPTTINLQTTALEHAAHRDPGLPLQAVIAGPDGSKEPRLAKGAGRGRVVRLLTYLPGTLLRHATPAAAQLNTCGRIQARLATALSDFDHPAADRHLLFDLQNFNELRELLPLIESQLIATVFSWHDEVLVPMAGALPRQILHSDFGLDNVVVDIAAPGYVTGILDWGDVVRTWRAADLASGLAAQITTEGPSWSRADDLLAGYQEHLPLTPAERTLLPGLVAMRLAQRILMAEWLSSARPSNAGYLRRNLTTSYQQLANLEY